MALYTCDDANCILFRKAQSFDHRFACRRTTSVSGPGCAVRELTIVDPSRTAPTLLASGAGSWGLGRSVGSHGGEAVTVALDTAAASPRRTASPALMIALPLTLLLIGSAGAWMFRQPLAGIAGLSGDAARETSANAPDVESVVAEALFTAGYSREISDKILSVRRQVDAIRERNEAATPELAGQLADVEARIKQNEAERRAAFLSYVRSVERLGRLRPADIAVARTAVDKRLARAGLARLAALLPVLDRQIAAARAGRIDHDRWIGEIETAPI